MGTRGEIAARGGLKTNSKANVDYLPVSKSDRRGKEREEVKVRDPEIKKHAEH